MIVSTEECELIEWEILGCYLKDLSQKQCGVLLGTGAQVWRSDKGNDTVEIYHDHIKALWERTKREFDWSTVGRPTARPVKNLRPKVPLMDFEGDPLDLQFLKFAKKINKLILEQKSPTYKDSWRKRGLVGIYHNLTRKWDRIENIMENHSKGKELDPEFAKSGGAVDFIDAVADLFGYCGKTMTYFEHMEMYQLALERWEIDNGLQDTEFVPKPEESQLEEPFGPVPPIPPE